MVEELARADAGTSVAVAVQSGLVASPLLRAGTDEQKARWLPRLATGELIGCYALTEPEAGSDTASLRTRAERADDGGWSISGSKQWITNGGFADLFVIFARTGGPGARGVSAFVSESAPGLTVSREMPKMGLHTSSTVELAFDGLHVADDAMLGPEGEGLKLALATLDGGRITIAAQACGIAQAALELAVSYATERQAFGGPIARFQGLQFPIADLAAALDAARLLTYDAAALRDAGQPHGRGGGQGEAVRVVGGGAGRGRRRADARGLRLLGRVPGGAATTATPRSPRSTRAPARSSALVIARDLFGEAARGRGG